MIPIGQRVLCCRKLANLTRKELACKMGLKLEGTITRIEMGETKPQPWTILKMALALGMTFQEFISGTDYEASISEFCVIPNQTVIAYRDADLKLRILYHSESDTVPYLGGMCERFQCYAGLGHNHCCYDCPNKARCGVACENDPAKCGLYRK